jgi:hypothetical protein
MQNLPILLAGLGCLLLIAIFWKAPAPQDDDLQAPEIDIDPDDFL